MKGFIKVTRAGYVDQPGMPTLLSLKAILQVHSQGHSQRAHITLSIQEQRFEDGPTENESFTVEESFDEVQQRMREATEPDEQANEVASNIKKIKNVLTNDILPAIENVTSLIESA